MFTFDIVSWFIVFYQWVVPTLPCLACMLMAAVYDKFFQFSIMVVSLFPAGFLFDLDSSVTTGIEYGVQRKVEYHSEDKACNGVDGIVCLDIYC